MLNHSVVSHPEWITARRKLLAKETELTRLRDDLARSWYSSLNNSFNFDYGVSYTREQVASGKAEHNNSRQRVMEELPGISVFYRENDGDVYHTYSTYRRGLDMLNGAYHYMDLLPMGRNEDVLPWTMAWLRRHDQYED